MNYKKAVTKVLGLVLAVILALIIAGVGYLLYQSLFNHDISKDNFCTQEVKECLDGSFVGRNSSNNCEFKTCPIQNNSNNNSS